MSANTFDLSFKLAKSNPSLAQAMQDALKNRLPKRQKDITAEHFRTDKQYNEFDKTLMAASRVLPAEDFKSVILDSLKSYYGDRYYAQCQSYLFRHRRANLIFNTAIVLLALGTFAILISITLFFGGSYHAIILTFIIGFIFEASGILIFGFNLRENNRIDKIANDLTTLANTCSAMSFVDLITDSRCKGKAIDDLLLNILKKEHSD